MSYKSKVSHSHFLEPQYTEDDGILPCNFITLVTLIIIEVVLALQFTYILSQVFPSCANKFYENFPCEKTRTVLFVEATIELTLSIFLIYLVTNTVRLFSEKMGENSLRCADTVVTIVPYLVLFFNKPLINKLQKIFPIIQTEK